MCGRKAKENINVVLCEIFGKLCMYHNHIKQKKSQYFIIKAILINQEDTLNILFASNIKEILFLIKLCLLFWYLLKVNTFVFLLVFPIFFSFVDGGQWHDIY